MASQKGLANFRHTQYEDDEVESKPDTMSSLIMWNISKIIYHKDFVKLKSALLSIQEKLNQNLSIVKALRQDSGSEDHYLTCALLAWREMKHTNADSLCDFIEKQLEKAETAETAQPLPKMKSVALNSLNPNAKLWSIKGGLSGKEDSLATISSDEIDDFRRDYCQIGPVVRLPVETVVPIVMRVDNTTPPSYRCKKHGGSGSNSKKSVEMSCCIESACADSLNRMDEQVKTLKSRLTSLAKREQQRIELIEKADATWKDLERSYQRRVRASEDKITDLEKQLEKSIKERQQFKEQCNKMTPKLKGTTAATEKLRDQLVALEKQVNERALQRHSLTEELARVEATAAEQQCKVSQLKNDQAFREEQANCQKMTLQSELDCERAIAFEAERILHAELSKLKTEIIDVSNELTKKDALTQDLTKELETLKKDYDNAVIEYTNCEKKFCDKLQAKLKELRAKRDNQVEQKKKVLECQCKLPVDSCVAVKRTASLVAACSCRPEDKLLPTCSCTSLRSRLMTDLFADLFSGLQSDLDETGIQMPCQLLLCLSDKHNWEKNTPVKTNVEKFFQKLLIQELDIAIANSIEKYHAKWVGASCADKRMIPEPCDPQDDGWEQRAVERRAHQLAKQIAEQMFAERTEQLTAEAKKIVSEAVACQCKKETSKVAVYQCTVKPPSLKSMHSSERSHPQSMRPPLPPPPPQPPRRPASAPADSTPYWQRTQQVFATLQTRLETLQKETVKKQDLKQIERSIEKYLKLAEAAKKEDLLLLEEKITANLQQILCQNRPVGEVEAPRKSRRDTDPVTVLGKRDCNKLIRSSTSPPIKPFASNRISRPPDMIVVKKRPIFLSRATKTSQPSVNSDKKKNSKVSFINTCFINNTQGFNQATEGKSFPSMSEQSVDKEESKLNKKLKPTKPVNEILPEVVMFPCGLDNKVKPILPCPDDYACLHKEPSTSSIDKLLETLKKWKLQKEYAVDHEVSRMSTPLLKTKKSNAQANVAFSKEIQCEQKTDVIKTFRDVDSRTRDTVCITKETDAIKIPESLNTTVHEKGIETECMCKAPSKIQLPKLETCKIDTFSCKPEKEHTIDIETHTSTMVIVTGTNTINALEKRHFGVDTCESSDYKINFLGATVTNRSSDHHTECSELVTENYSEGRDEGSPKSKSLHNSMITFEDEYERALGKLEAETYELLKEHINGKMEEFHENCHIKAIPKDEENKLISSILQKLKDVICNSSCDEVDCNNSHNLNIKTTISNWSRAHSLLQEYLENKLKKAQNACVLNKSSATLSEIVNKVCSMIENDFGKLRNLFSHEAKSQSNVSDKSDDGKHTIPEKDISHSSHVNEKFRACNSKLCVCQPEMISRPVSIIHCVVADVMTSQITINTGKYNKLCDAVCALDSKILQTDLETKTCGINVISEKSDFGCICDRSLLENLKNHGSKSSDIGPHDEFVVLSTDDIEQNTKINPIPYFGLTVQCSCDKRLGGCVCSKSQVKGEYFKGKEIWEKFAPPNIYKDLKSSSLIKYYLEKKSDCQPHLERPSDEKQESAITISCDCRTSCHYDLILKNSKSFNEPTESKQICASQSDTVTNSLCENAKDCSSFPILPCIKSDAMVANIKECDWQHCTCGSQSTSEPEPKRCTCSSVPVCHVKLLMNNIEEKLTQSKCTCDALHPAVCPIHGLHVN